MKEMIRPLDTNLMNDASRPVTVADELFKILNLLQQECVDSYKREKRDSEIEDTIDMILVITGYLPDDNELHTPEDRIADFKTRVGYMINRFVRLGMDKSMNIVQEFLPEVWRRR